MAASGSRLQWPASKNPPTIPEYYAASHFPESMPDVVDTNNPIQGMLSHAAMMSARRKAQKLSAYDPDPKRIQMVGW